MRSFTTLICFLGFTFLTLQTYGQSSISGSVEESSGKLLSFANVLLLHATDSSLVKGMISNENGHYSLDKVLPGEYMITASMVGYKPVYSSAFTLLQQEGSMSIATLILAEDVQQLGEVVVEAQRPLYDQQLDKLVVNVQSSITLAGASALEVLERSPGVAINQQGGVIALNGKEGVAVMINGKLSRMPVSAVVEMLRGMNSANIEKIELISNPPARYDAEGAGGLINLVLKKNTDYGTNGSVSLTVGYGYGEKAGSNLTLNHRTAKLNLYGDYSFFRNRTLQSVEMSRSFLVEETLMYTSNLSQRWPTTTNHTARAGFDYMLGPHTILGGSVAGYNNKWQMEAMNHTMLPEVEYAATSVLTDNDEINHWRHLMGNLNLAQTFRHGQELRLDVDYLWYHDDNPNDFDNQYSNAGGEVILQQQTRIRKETPIRMGVAKLDYRQQLGENMTLEAGVKGNFSRFTNDVQFAIQQAEEWITDPVFTQKHYLEENIAAAYTSWQVQVNSKTKVVAGLRYEFTDTDLSSDTEEGIVDREYGSFFPNLLVSYDFHQNSAVQFSYGRRITRPAFNDLAPFVIFMGPKNFISGNPALQPAFIHTVKMQYQWQDFMVSLQYSDETNTIVPFQPHFDAETNVYLYYAENLKEAKAITLMAVLPWQPASWWSMQNTLMGTHQQLTADYLEKPEQVVIFNARINVTHKFQLPYDFSLELSGYYQSPFLFGMQSQKAIGAVNVGLQKKFKNESGTLSLTWDDLFWTTAWRWDYSSSENQLNSRTVIIFSEPRIVKLTYTRSFGNKKLKAAKRATGSEEEQRRVN